MTLAETGQVMDLLEATYPRFYANADAKSKDIVLQTWASLFEPYPQDLVLAAITAHIAADTKGFPPSIGQIMAKVRKITEPEEMPEQEAWSLVRKAISRSGYDSREEFDKLPPVIQQVIHDPAQLKAWAIDEDFNENVVSSNFMRSYRTKMQSIREFRAMPKDVQALAAKLGNGLALPGEEAGNDEKALPPKAAG